MYQDIPEDRAETEVDENENWEEVKAPGTYYSICNIVDKYFDNISIATGEYNENKKEKAKIVVNSVMRNYFNSNNMGKQQREEWYEKYKDNTLIINKTYERYLGDLMEAYYIKGTLSKTQKEYDLLILLDKEIYAYTIFPMEYIENELGTDLLNFENIEQLNQIKITKDYYNEIEHEYISIAQMAENYFNDFINVLKTDTKKAYSLINEDYRKENFETYEDFEKYVKKNLGNLEDIKCTFQKCFSESDYTINYICKDSNGNYYTFKAIAVMNYSVILDNIENLH